MKPARAENVGKLLVIACGALSKEILWLKKHHKWLSIDLQCIDAALHNKPDEIPRQLKSKIALNRDKYEYIFVAYADCGTGGDIDRLIAEEGVQRLPGAHCYSFYAGEAEFMTMSEDEPGTFYLTDFLVEHFERIVIKGLGLNRYPDLYEQYFGNYRRLMYLSQIRDQRLVSMAEQAAQFLGLDFEHRHCGFGDLKTALETQVLRLL